MDEQLRQLKRQLRWTQFAFGVCVLAAIGVVFFATRRSGSDVIHVRGIVVEDATGTARVLIGAPIPNSGRKRNDDVTGIVVLGDGGVDRVAVAYPEPSPQMDGTVSRRTERAAGIVVNDAAGNERGGFGTFDDGHMVLGMDYPKGKGEAITMDIEGVGNSASLAFHNADSYVRTQFVVNGNNPARLVKMSPQPDRLDFDVLRLDSRTAARFSAPRNVEWAEVLKKVDSQQ